MTRAAPNPVAVPLNDAGILFKEPEPPLIARLRGLLFQTVTFFALTLLEILVGAFSLVALVAADGAAFDAAIDEAVAGVPVYVASATVSHSCTPSVP